MPSSLGFVQGCYIRPAPFHVFYAGVEVLGLTPPAEQTIFWPTGHTLKHTCYTLGEHLAHDFKDT